ncbi:hypothetical protein X975_26060, partial [Stegodyphus mimosarum]
MCIIIVCVSYICASRGRQNEVDESGQRRNPAFDNQDERSASVAARMEPPPCYEDVMKYDAFRGFLTSANDKAIKNIINETQRPNVKKNTLIIEMMPLSTISSTSNRPDLPHNAPTLATGCCSNPSRSDTGSSSSFPHLTTVSEQVDANLPVTVVVDSIGVCSAQILNSCDTSVEMANSDEQTTQTRC